MKAESGTQSAKEDKIIVYFFGVNLFKGGNNLQITKMKIVIRNSDIPVGVVSLLTQEPDILHYLIFLRAQ